MTGGVTEALRMLASDGLAGSRLTAPVAPVAGYAFPALARALSSHRVTGLALQAAGEARFPVTDLQYAQLQDQHAKDMQGCLQLEAALLDVVRSAAQHGIPLRVIKGPASAHLDYASPELRSFGDVDVLVRSQDIDVMVWVLHAMGYTRPAPEPRPGFDRRFGKGVTFLSDAGPSLDLHRTLVMGPAGLRVDLPSLWQHRKSFVVAGVRLDSLSTSHRLLVACYNAVLCSSAPRLGSLRDVVQLALSSDLDAAEVLAAATRWRAEPILARGLTAAWRAFDLEDVTDLSAWADGYQPDAKATRLLRLYTDSHVRYAELCWASVGAVGSTRDRLAFLSALALPSGGRLGPEGLAGGQRLARAARVLTARSS